MSVVIRQALASDSEQLSALFNDYRKFYEQPNDMNLAVQFIQSRLNNKDSVILVAVNDKQRLLGFCQMYPTFCSVIAAPVCVLYDLFVDSAARKTGAGKQMMLAAYEYASNNGFARLDLTTAKTNHAAQSLYESLGWKRDEIFYMYSKSIPN